MIHARALLIIACLLHSHEVLSLWSCTQNSHCSSLVGSICSDGDCVCPPGQQSVLGGTLCIDEAPYHMSSCVEDHQCSRLVTAFSCRKNVNETEGFCFCLPGFHFFLGRCWPSISYGEECSRDEECFGTIREPYSLSCEGTCGCAPGYYSRQAGECRKIGSGVGEGCVIDEDCQFANGRCNISTFRCYDINAEPAQQLNLIPETLEVAPAVTTRQHGVACGGVNTCPTPFICSQFGGCICPSGYYASEDGSRCLAELGSPSTEEQCTGLFAEVRDGICTCQANFFFEESMRDCIKATRVITDSCVTDSNCHTFGAATRCGQPQDPWGFRTCECIPELAVWDSSRNMCRLYAGIGESCQVDSDCMAGELEIQCVVDGSGQGVCSCPQGLVEVDGLCLTTGLALGDACQVTQECTETDNTVCTAGRCSCGEGYREVDDYCAPMIGGECDADSDCVIENTDCQYNATANASACQCRSDFIAYDDECWPTVFGYESVCNLTAQCTAVLGQNSICEDSRCTCIQNTHHRDGGCWPITARPCSRESDCAGISSASCVRTHFDPATKCLCGDNQPPFNGQCDAQTKTLYHVCANTDECNVGLICGQPNTTSPMPPHLRGLSPGSKICLCDTDSGYQEHEHTCSDADILKTSLFAIVFVSCLRKIITY